VCQQFGDRLDICIVRASLIVGAAENGWIGRFNGLYPLVRLVALAETPCVIGDSTYKIDMVPLDWFVDELEAAIAQLSNNRRFVRVTAVSGKKAAPIASIVDIVQERANRLLLDEGLAPHPKISVIGRRQYDFLMKAAKSWAIHDNFYHVERVTSLMEGYLVHGESGRAITPVSVATEPPDPLEYLPIVVDYWLSRNLKKVLRPRQSSWRLWEGQAQ